MVIAMNGITSLLYMSITRYIAIIGLILSIFASVLPVRDAQAQFYYVGSGTTVSGQTPQTYSGCLLLTSNLIYGSRDYYTNGEVSKVQSFLALRGYLSSYLITGFYGRMTYMAVQRFQSDNRIQPTGGVGPITRAQIQALTCGTGSQPPVIDAPVITSISPSSGAVGSYVTVYGSGFSSRNTVVFGSNGSVPKVVSSNGTSLTFRVPDNLVPACYYATPACAIGLIYRQTTPGAYAIAITNERGTSNTFNFTVSSTTSTSIDQTVTASIYQTVYVGDLALTPTGIAEDSRCPEDVVCIQAGKVVVNTNLRGPNTQTSAALHYGATNSIS